MPHFSKEQIEQKDKNSITNQFNENVASEFLRLDENQIQITLYDGGADLADLKRMRHYHISPDGKTELCAQFYYAAENTSIGNYKIEQGFFVCGVIDIMGSCFEALFSMRESEGVLAYGKIPSIDLGFLKIDESEYNKKEKLPIPKDSLLSQFLNNDKEGMVFYLSAGKDEVSFYFDGSIEILRLHRTDARIQLSSSMAMIESMQNIYADNMGVTLEEYNSLNLSLRYAMNDVESILQAGVQSGNVAELGTAMGGLKRSVAYQEKKGVFRENQLSDTKNSLHSMTRQEPYTMICSAA